MGKSGEGVRVDLTSKDKLKPPSTQSTQRRNCIQDLTPDPSPKMRGED
jgi:hypothetical protein